MSRCILILLTGLPLLAQMDPREIVRRSVQVDDRNNKIARDYTYRVHNVVRELDGKGVVKSSHTNTREVMYIGGKQYRRLTEKDGKPLSPDEERKERANIDKAIAQAKKLSAEERQRRIEEREKSRAKDREGLLDIPDAFDFALLREEAVGGRNAFVIRAEPRSNYQGKHRDFLSKIHGTLWIDKSDFHWIKVEAETLGTISFGMFIARLAPGSHLEFEQTRVNGEIWLPKRGTVKASARLALVKKLNLEQETDFSNYRKFQTDSKIVSTAEVP